MAGLARRTQVHDHMGFQSILLPVAATLLLLLSSCILFLRAWADVHHYDFVVSSTPYTRLCETKGILTINGQFPGPTLYANKGDTIIIHSYNNASYGLTIHWHGLKQPRNPWSDGTDFVTMCKVPPGGNFTYTLLFSDEEGTIWYHAHSDWTRATVHGAIVVYPKKGTNYPFTQPDKDYVVILGEWWKEDVMEVMDEGLKSGADFALSDANTINGQPGDQLPCSREGTTRFTVEQGKTYLFRIVNAGLTTGFWLAIQNHTVTVVGTDGSYLKPFQTEYVFVDAGQTLDILMTANQSNDLYYMAASAYDNDAGESGVVDPTIATAIVEYSGYNSSSSPIVSLSLPFLPANNDTLGVFDFGTQRRSLVSEDHPIEVPIDINTRLAMTASVNLLPCTDCTDVVKGYRFASSMNNVSFLNPSIDILEAYYDDIENVFADDFPSFPPTVFNFTDTSLEDVKAITTRATKVKVLEYNETVELLIQGTSFVNGAVHPMHLHGYKFYVVDRGFGNFDPEKDPLNYNLVDPPAENTVSIPYLGWVVVRFKASNPGVWLMHCHFDRHYSWGMSVVFIVKNGPTNDTGIHPPPPYMPNCSDELRRGRPGDHLNLERDRRETQRSH